MMRNILVDHSRAHKAAKPGASEYMPSISKADRLSKKPALDLVALDDALNDQAAIRPQHSRLVELRFFAGLTIEGTAEILGVSHATVERDSFCPLLASPGAEQVRERRKRSAEVRNDDT